MTVICVGEVNVDYSITNESPWIPHWNAVNANKRKGGMVWNTGRTIDLLGHSVFLFSPHGDDFRQAPEAAMHGRIFPYHRSGFRDNLCLSLFDLNGNRATVYMPFESQASYFHSMAGILDQFHEKGVKIDPESSAIFVSCTEETYSALSIDRSGFSIPIYLSLSNVIKYWSPEAVGAALECSDFVFLNHREVGLLESIVGGLSPDIFRKKLRLLVVTHGEQGVTCHGPPGTKAFGLPFERVERADEVGAGDTFAGGFIYGMVAGKSLDECVMCGQVSAFLFLKNGQRADLQGLEKGMESAKLTDVPWKPWSS